MRIVIIGLTLGGVKMGEKLKSAKINIDDTNWKLLKAISSIKGEKTQDVIGKAIIEFIDRNKKIMGGKVIE